MNRQAVKTARKTIIHTANLSKYTHDLWLFVSKYINLGSVDPDVKVYTNKQIRMQITSSGKLFRNVHASNGLKIIIWYS